MGAEGLLVPLPELLEVDVGEVGAELILEGDMVVGLGTVLLDDFGWFFNLLFSCPMRHNINVLFADGCDRAACC